MTAKRAFYFSADYLLSEETKRRCLENFTKQAVFRLSNNKATKNAAVLVPLCEANGELSLLYTVRSSDLRSHAGLVAFPGGHADTTDENFAATALRETEEEIGISKSDVEIWGASQMPLHTITSNLAVFPVFGFIRRYDSMTLKPNPDEVERVFTMPIESLCDPKNVEFQVFEQSSAWKFTMPRYRGGPKKIWGITALITDAYLRSILPDDVYNLNQPTFQQYS